MKFKVIALATAAALAVGGSAHAAASLVASYGFNSTLASSVGGPALTAVDPTAGASYVTDTVNGVTRTVYQTAGSTTPALQGGLNFDGTGLISNANGYSVELTFEFLTRDGAWRRILDSLDRTSDNGFYADPNNDLDVYPVTGSTAGFVADAYRNVVITVDPNAVTDNVHAYIDQGSNLVATTNVMNLTEGSLTNPNDLLGLFLDNTAGGGQGEWSAVRVATVNVFSGVLTQDQADAFDGQTFSAGVPEPTAWAMMLAGFGGLGALLRRRRAQAAFA
ncbi:PEPxxWA-CTERM sorting domain-containing protein [Phenylobacterium sp.]|uniref:PEPxxWA-CTERM sorting domain-containing protein n=1 Tax=Phenylobacterium sp. TaxID=1871053 RepID=UPI0025D268E9|nr:PEPxxWA-CTERM sorting domain-containing protein [Phenylobacterium sp.]